MCLFKKSNENIFPNKAEVFDLRMWQLKKSWRRENAALKNSTTGIFKTENLFTFVLIDLR